MNQLDDNTLDEIARLICGDDGPVYRQGWELPRFLQRAEWENVPDHDGAPRRDWVLARLRERRDRASDIEAVILRLADPREYLGEPPGTVTEAAQRLNGFLVYEGCQIQLPGGRPRIVECDPALGYPSELAPVELQTTMSDLVADPAVAAVLQNRLDEAQTCHKNGAHVAAIIMLGSLLEGVLLEVLRARTPPGVKPLRDGTRLEELIEMAHRNGWIQADAKKFSHELRDYRNLVHVRAQVRMGDVPDGDTVKVCWYVVVATLNDLWATGERRLRGSPHP
jgi:hypothetical protein